MDCTKWLSFASVPAILVDLIHASRITEAEQLFKVKYGEPKVFLAHQSWIWKSNLYKKLMPLTNSPETGLFPDP